MIERYFQTQSCIDLPMTDIRSRYFWKTEPFEFHDFDSIRAINDNKDDELSEIDEQVESSESEAEVDERNPMTVDEFHQVTHWYNWNPDDFGINLCPICRTDFRTGRRISVLNCHHEFHSDCIQQWLTTRRASCPTCREAARITRLRNNSLMTTPTTGGPDDDDIASLSESMSSLGSADEPEQPTRQTRSSSPRPTNIARARARERRTGSSLRNPT